MNKLILLDGTYGVGKSTVAHCICKINDSYVCVDPDEYYNNYGKRYFKYGGPASNNSALRTDIQKIVKEIILNRNVIIPVTLFNQELMDTWMELFSDIAEVKHFVLYADKKTIEDRINHDEGRDKGFALDSLDNNVRYYHNITIDSPKINTSDLTPEETPKRILELVKLSFF